MAEFRQWLATNRCLNALRPESHRPRIGWRVPDVEPLEPTRRGEVVWLEPYPDLFLEGRPFSAAANGARPSRQPAPCIRYGRAEVV